MLNMKITIGVINCAAIVREFPLHRTDRAFWKKLKKFSTETAQMGAAIYTVSNPGNNLPWPHVKKCADAIKFACDEEIPHRETIGALTVSCELIVEGV